jgi:hypothetical protein
MDDLHAVRAIRKRCLEIRDEFQAVHNATDWTFGQRIERERELIDEFSNLTHAFSRIIASRPEMTAQ